MSKTYLISGGNRGIGKGLVAKLLSRPQSTLIVLVRDPSHDTSESLSSLPKAEGSKLIVEKYDAASTDSPFNAIKAVQSTNHIDVLDIVIANSGILTQYGPVSGVKASELESHFFINAVAPILLFQATLPLLKKSSNPKFFTISTSVASIGSMGEEAFDAVAYGVSKVAVNYAMRKLHFENADIVFQPLHPGWVKTEMGQYAADKSGFVERPPVELEQSVDGLLSEIDRATKEETSGRFFGFDGQELPW